MKGKRQRLSRTALERLVVRAAAGEWGCEGSHGRDREKCDPSIHGRNWTVTSLQNEDLPAAAHAIAAIADRLGKEYELEEGA